VSSPESL